MGTRSNKPDMLHFIGYIQVEAKWPRKILVLMQQLWPGA